MYILTILNLIIVTLIIQTELFLSLKCKDTFLNVKSI